MRHSLITLAAAAVVAVCAFGAGPAKAAPLPNLDGVSSHSGSVEPARYYRRWGYRPYYRPYRYYAPRYYGYSYRPYYRNYYYGYRPYYRPYYGRRYW
jgi:hypothetical protein